jgi:hypothetical protein
MPNASTALQPTGFPMRINPVRFAAPVTWLYSLWIQSIRYDDNGFMRAIEMSLATGKPLMLAIFHEELFALTGLGMRFLHERTATVASDSRDGELIARVLERIGFKVARGSSTRGGLKAMLQLKRFMDQGRIGVMTVDGPRGPRRKPKDGTIFLTQKAGALLIPVRAHCPDRWVAEKSWDKFQIPKPFSTCHVHFGQPMKVTQEKLNEDLLIKENERLEQALLSLLPDQ